MQKANKEQPVKVKGKKIHQETTTVIKLKTEIHYFLAQILKTWVNMSTFHMITLTGAESLGIL